ncbi:hypothetical protein [Taibaiella soli]|uniref:Uncharacterized protein n=1 Tax=Taibaiella soli TaxID=1649169 RepID=A0A2W2ABZ1_9BACT|nr:hypothetical protein [Taibaiella soli]PZF71142.1 hypothetical protein DN068_19390 [Taibaiella soli]
MKQEQQLPLAKDSTNAPHWVGWPLQLTVQEIADPQTVIDRFFHQYTLAEVRMLLQDWLLTVIDTQQDVGGYVSLCNDMVRFTEAVFMTQGNELAARVLAEANCTVKPI